jgi:putative ABC transport system permease protein
VAHVLLRALAGTSSLDLPRMAGARIDGAALAFTAAAALMTTLLFGLVPALSLVGRPPVDALKQTAAGGTIGRRQSKLLACLVSAQFALALVLLAGAGLLLRSFGRMLAADPGFQPDHVLAVTLSLPNTAYQRAADIRSFYARLEEKASALPGVSAVGGSNALPLRMSRQITFTVDEAARAADGTPPTASAEFVSGDYFSALGIKLDRGRLFSPQDGPQSEPVAIVNRTLARHFYPGGAVGRRIRFGLRSGLPWMTIVGVVGDVKQGPLDGNVLPGIFQPLAQVADATVADPLAGGIRGRHLVVRTQGDPLAAGNALRAAVRALDPALAIGKVETLSALLDESSAPRRFNTILLGSFSAAALLLAALGAGGLLFYTTTQRSREIGIRLALGASRRDIVRMVVARGLKLAGVGMAIGLVAALAVTKLVSKLLYEVSPADPWTFAAVCGTLALAALLATLIPARRAASVDPVKAVRQE